MIDASHCKVHLQASEARGINQDMNRTKEGSTQKYIWSWMRMAWYAGQNPYHTRYHCRLHASWHLIEGGDADYLSADRGYDRFTVEQEKTEYERSYSAKKYREILRSYDNEL